MKLEVEFDNQIDDDYVKLHAPDLIVKVPGHPILVPTSVFAGRHATYELPDGMKEDAFIEALENLDWCYTQLSEVA